jgi:hypothetical protein
MTGTAPSPKQAVTEFEIDPETNIIKKCPEGFVPANSAIKKSQSVAHFPLDVCTNCEQRDQCRVKQQKKSFVVRINKEAITAAMQRIKIQNEHKLNISVRAAIEGANSALKRGQGLRKLEVRGQAKCTVVAGLKVITHNFKLFANYMLEQAKDAPIPEQRESVALLWQ